MNPEICRHTLEIRNLSARKGGIEVLSGINADIRCGRVTALIGPNGAGKTMLLHAILGQVPYTGEIRFCRHKEHGGGSPRIGYIPQHFAFDRETPLTVLDFFALSAQKRPVFLGISRAVRRMALESLERAEVAHLADRRLGRLSGGELQRVLFALILHDSPDILLLDEPVSGVDLAGGEQFSRFLSQIHNDARFSLLLVSHDLSLVARQADEVICLNRRIIRQGMAKEVLTAENLAEIYGDDIPLFLHYFAGKDQSPREPRAAKG
ncbi:MAG: metal ABC transporter ATP-binding protein [Syntrophorhabdaceae bacterium]|nr:metal ABC transporter ATP-binding protein [Syntrophorhabdaceae bacterium]